MSLPESVVAGAVLVADDAAPARSLLLGLLDQLGYRAVGVAAGPAAVEALDQASDAFGLALIDIDMPGLDGPATAAAIRRLADPPPLIGLAAAGRPAEAERAAAAGMATSLEKPVRREALGRALARWYRAPVGDPPPIDLAHLARYTGREAALERELMDMFLANAERYLAEMAPAAVDNAWHRAAHTLKGAARGIGAGEVASLAEAAERLVGAAAGAVERQRATRALRVALAVLARAVEPTRLAVWRAERSL